MSRLSHFPSGPLARWGCKFAFDQYMVPRPALQATHDRRLNLAAVLLTLGHLALASTECKHGLDRCTEALSARMSFLQLTRKCAANRWAWRIFLFEGFVGCNSKTATAICASSSCHSNPATDTGGASSCRSSCPGLTSRSRAGGHSHKWRRRSSERAFGNP